MWLAADSGIESHEKVLALRAELGWTEDQALLGLFRYLAWVRRERYAGDLPDDLADRIPWIMRNGDLRGQAVVEAMVKCRLIDRTETGRLRAHNWMERNGRFLNSNKRKAATESVARHKNVGRATKTSDAPHSATGHEQEHEQEQLESKSTPPTSPPLKTKAAPRGKNHSPSPEEQAAFEAWYSLYPRHVNRSGALSSYLGCLRRGFSASSILSGTQAWYDAWEAQNTPQNKIPHPTTFLNQERFQDTEEAQVLEQEASHEKNQTS